MSASQDGNCQTCDVPCAIVVFDGIAWACCDECGYAYVWASCSRGYRNRDEQERNRAIDTLQHYILIDPRDGAEMQPPRRTM